MRFKKEEKDTLKFCAESLAALASLKGNTEANASEYFKSLAGLVANQDSNNNRDMVTASVARLRPEYNKAADVVAASLYNLSQGNTEAALKMFATVVDTQDYPVLAQSLMQYNEAAMEAKEVLNANVSDMSDGFGETDDDYIDEDDDGFGPVGEGDVTTMEGDEPLFSGGEEDVLYFDPDTDQDTDVTDDEDLIDGEDVDEVVLASLDLQDDDFEDDDFELEASLNGEDGEEDVKPCSVDPITDRKLSKNRPAKKPGKTHTFDEEADEDKNKPKNSLDEEKKVESRLLKVLSSAAFKKMDKETQRDITTVANKISMPGDLSSKKEALKFVNAALNSF